MEHLWRETQWNLWKPIGWICSFRPIEGGLPGKNNSFPPSSDCKYLHLYQTVHQGDHNWRGMPEMTTQNEARRSHSPLTGCKTTRTSHKRRKHNPTLMQRFHLGAESETDWDIIHRTGEGCEISPLSALRPSLEKDAQPPCAATWHRRRARAHKQAQPTMRRRLRLRLHHNSTASAAKDWVFFPLQCQKVTLRPVPDSASTPSRCAQRGGAPRHRRASGGVAQRLPSNGGQNQAVKKKQVWNGREEKISFQVYMSCRRCDRWC